MASPAAHLHSLAPCFVTLGWDASPECFQVGQRWKVHLQLPNNPTCAESKAESKAIASNRQRHEGPRLGRPRYVCRLCQVEGQCIEMAPSIQHWVMKVCLRCSCLAPSWLALGKLQSQIDQPCTTQSTEAQCRGPYVASSVTAVPEVQFSHLQA